MSIKKAAQSLITGGHEVREASLNMIEMAFRAYDPCFGCATHAALGRMPLQIEIREPDGRTRETIRRFC